MATRRLHLGLFILFAFFLLEDAKGSRVGSSTLSKKGQADYQTVEVTFRIDQQVGYGEGFVVAGNTSQFGNWDSEKGIQLKYSDGNVWTATVKISSYSAIEFKPVIVDYDTKKAKEWLYLSENLVLLVPPTNPSVTVLMFWCTKSSSLSTSTYPVFNKLAHASEQKIAFQLARQTDVGQGFAVTGSISELGNWTPQDGLALSYNTGNIWTGNMTLSSGSSFQYKPVRVVYGSNSPLEWAADPNRNVVIPGDIDEPIVIPVRWSSCPSGGSVEILITEVV